MPPLTGTPAPERTGGNAGNQYTNIGVFKPSQKSRNSNLDFHSSFPRTSLREENMKSEEIISVMLAVLYEVLKTGSLAKASAGQLLEVVM